MNFKFKELTYEHMIKVVHFKDGTMECTEWVNSLPKELQTYAIDAIYKANDNLENQRKTEANRKIFIRTILQEIRATANGHITNAVIDSPLVKAIEK